MNDVQPPTAEAIITEPVGLLRTAAAVLSVIYAVIVAPKPFFGAIGAASNANVLNAVGFFAIAVALYVILQSLFELGLGTFAGYETQLLISYYAKPFAAAGTPLATAIGFFAAVGQIAAEELLSLAQWTIVIWFVATAFVHTGKVASLKAMLTASLYASGAIMLALSILGLPAIYFDQANDPQSLLAAPGTTLSNIATVATAAGLTAKYQLIGTYLYLRSLSFTTDLRLHWGLVFTLLLGAIVGLAMRTP